jgi:hypothetical protein
MANVMTYQELKALFCASEQLDPPIHLTAYITFDDGYSNSFSIAERTYAVSSANTAFQPDCADGIIVGSNLADIDMYARIDDRMADENGGEDGWQIECCSLERPTLLADDHGERNEFFGEIIDLFEDFLDERGVHIENSERDTDNAAIIYGSDYDELYEGLAHHMRSWHLM